MKKILFALVFAVISLAIGAEDSNTLEQIHAAALRGNADAQMEMGTLYEFGYQREKNNITALAWYLSAAKQGHVLAVKRRDLLQSKMTPAQVEEARHQSEQLTKSP